jgi:hypothetical protein
MAMSFAYEKEGTNGNIVFLGPDSDGQLYINMKNDYGHNVTTWLTREDTRELVHKLSQWLQETSEEHEGQGGGCLCHGF